MLKFQKTVMLVLTLLVAHGSPALADDSVAGKSLLSAGTVMFGVPYLGSVMAGASSARSYDRWLYVPVAGPWLDLNARSDCHSALGCNASKFLLVTDGILQGVGAFEILAGALVSAAQQGSRVDFEARSKDVPTTASVRVGPALLGPGGYGVSAVGVF